MSTALFHSFMRERHEIYLRRKAGQAWPWTQDPVLQRYRFCNVYRELDIVTIWVRQHIREPFAEHPNLWFMLAAARQVNHPDSLAELIADRKGAWPTGKLRSWKPERFRAVLNDRKARGEQVYTGAYMLTNILDKNDHRQPHDKPWFTAYKCLGSLVPMEREVTLAAAESMEATHSVLRQGYGWGGFLAYEVCCDMRWTRYGTRWSDKASFCHAGPGALRGLNRIHGRPLTPWPPEQQAKTEMVALWHEAKHMWPRPSTKYPVLEMREIEHTLCEFDKHQRVVLGEGRPRTTYKPPKEI